MHFSSIYVSVSFLACMGNNTKKLFQSNETQAITTGNTTLVTVHAKRYNPSKIRQNDRSSENNKERENRKRSKIRSRRLKNVAQPEEDQVAMQQRILLPRCGHRRRGRGRWVSLHGGGRGCLHQQATIVVSCHSRQIKL